MGAIFAPSSQQAICYMLSAEPPEQVNKKQLPDARYGVRQLSFVKSSRRYPFPALRYSLFMRYPIPTCVWNSFGCAGAVSSFRRRDAMNTRNVATSLSRLLPQSLSVM